MSGPMICQWFAACTNEANGVVKHFIMGEVPTCSRCANKLGLKLEQPVSETLLNLINVSLPPHHTAVFEPGDEMVDGEILILYHGRPTPVSIQVGSDYVIVGKDDPDNMAIDFCPTRQPHQHAEIIMDVLGTLEGSL